MYGRSSPSCSSVLSITRMHSSSLIKEYVRFFQFEIFECGTKCLINDEHRCLGQKERDVDNTKELWAVSILFFTTITAVDHPGYSRHESQLLSCASHCIIRKNVSYMMKIIDCFGFLAAGACCLISSVTTCSSSFPPWICTFHACTSPSWATRISTRISRADRQAWQPPSFTASMASAMARWRPTSRLHHRSVFFLIFRMCISLVYACIIPPEKIYIY